MQPAPAAQAPIDLLPYGPVTDEELQRLRRARDEFLSRRGTDTELRTVIRRSWKRCSQWGVQPDLRVLEVRTEPRLDATVQRVSHAILHHLAQRIYRTRAAVLLTDDRGVIADWSGDGEVRQLLEQVQAVPGAALSEEITGTNAIGTALEEGIGVQICSGEHFIEAFQVFACTAIPIRHPLTNRVLAVLDLTTRAQEISPAVARLVARAARDPGASARGVNGAGAIAPLPLPARAAAASPRRHRVQRSHHDLEYRRAPIARSSGLRHPVATHGGRPARHPAV
jgi:transcriptional regulator of acetoin/glycerol metabolism